ncbi:metallophosphoesterase family protein [Bacteroides sp.]
MKHIYLWVTLSFVWQITFAQNETFLKHGPYLMNPTTDKVSVLFQTQQRALSWIEVREENTENMKRFQSCKHGLKEAFNLYNTILLDSLKPDISYQYRVCSQSFVTFEPYKKVKNETQYTDWHTFTTLPVRKKEIKFCVLNDIHDNAELMEKLLNHTTYKESNFVVMNGDMSNLIEQEEQPYIIFDKATELFARQIPILYVRGNHETRGKYARVLHHYVDCSSGKYYGFLRTGNCAIIVLDSGDEDGDDAPAYVGTIAFDSYRSEQTQWLETIVKSKDFLEAEHRIVFAHIPPIGANSRCQAVLQTQREWIPILNRAGIDLLVCGHTHQLGFVPKKTPINDFPVVINAKNTIMEISVPPTGEMDYKIINENGEIVLRKH